MANGPMPIGPQVISGMRRAPKPKYRTGGAMADFTPYESSGWGTLAGDTSAPPPPPSPMMPVRGPAPFNYYPGFNNAAQGQSMGIGINVLGAGTGGPPLPVTNPYALGTAPIQRKAAGASGYASSFEKARAMNKPGGGLLTNAEAGSLYDETGYMPSVTIGGNWNRRPMGRSPMAGLSTKQQKDIMRIGNQPMPQQGLPPSTPMTRDEIVNMVRPMGLEYDRMGSSPLARRGTPRWQALVEQGVIDPDARVLEASTGLRESLREQGLMQGQPSQEQLDMNRMAYQERRGADMAGRRALIQDRAARASDRREQALANRGVQQGPDVLGMMAAQNPEVALRVMQLRQQGRIAEAELAMRQGALALQGAELMQRGALGQGELNVRENESRARMMQLQNENARYGRQDQIATAGAAGPLYQAAGVAFEEGRQEEGEALQAMADQLTGRTRQEQTEGGARMPLTPAQVERDINPIRDNPRMVLAELRRKGFAGQSLREEFARIMGPGRTLDDPTGMGGYYTDEQGNVTGQTAFGTLYETMTPYLGNANIGGATLFEYMNRMRPVARPSIRGVPVTPGADSNLPAWAREPGRR